jgi:hypothetical protein
LRTFLVLLALVASCDDSGSVQKLPIGSPCSSDAQCGTGAFFCARTGHPNGYCKKDCRVDVDCPTGSVCAGAGMVSKGECHKICNGAADCRSSEGYVCVPHADEATHNFCDAPEPTGDGGA